MRTQHVVRGRIQDHSVRVEAAKGCVTRAGSVEPTKGGEGGCTARPQPVAQQADGGGGVAGDFGSTQICRYGEVARVALEVAAPVQGVASSEEVGAVGEGGAGQLGGAVGLVGAYGRAVTANTISGWGALDFCVLGNGTGWGAA